jgi:hypothetical protein
VQPEEIAEYRLVPWTPRSARTATHPGSARSIARSGELGAGAASLYRYVETREDLLDLMTDAIGAEYELAPPSSNWLADHIARVLTGLLGPA